MSNVVAVPHPYALPFRSRQAHQKLAPATLRSCNVRPENPPLAELD